MVVFNTLSKSDTPLIAALAGRRRQAVANRRWRAAQRAGGCRPGRGLGKGSGFGEIAECGTKIIQNGLSEGWLYKFSAEHCTGDPRLRFCTFEPCGYNINFVEQANAYSTSIPTLRGRWNIISQRMIFHETDAQI